MSHILLLLCLLLLQTAASEDHTEVKVTPGQKATLQCSCPKDAAITLLEWSRPESKSKSFIFYRNSYERYQNESFKSRMELKNGDLTFILKNITISDTGTYKCRIMFRNTSSSERLFNEFKCFINLTVTASDEDGKDGGDKDGGDKDGGDKDGGDKDGGEKDGGDKDGGAKDGGDKDGSFSLIAGLSVPCLLLLLLLLL